MRYILVAFFPSEIYWKNGKSGKFAFPDVDKLLFLRHYYFFAINFCSNNQVFFIVLWRSVKLYNTLLINSFPSTKEISPWHLSFFVFNPLRIHGVILGKKRAGEIDVYCYKNGSEFCVFFQHNTLERRKKSLSKISLTVCKFIYLIKLLHKNF